MILKFDILKNVKIKIGGDTYNRFFKWTCKLKTGVETTHKIFFHFYYQNNIRMFF